MPPAIDEQIKGQVIKEWLSGSTRDEVAKNNGIGAGSVSNIINEWKKGNDSKDYDSIRELSIFLKDGGMTFNDLASNVRLNNYIKKLGANSDQIESFIKNIATSQEPQKLVDTANQIAQITTIPLDKIPDHIKQQRDELQNLKEEIEKARTILEEKNVDVQTIEGYERLEEGLEKYGLSIESPRKLVSVLLKINQLGYDAPKIVKEWAQINSLKLLKNECKVLESRITRYKEIIPLCEQIKRLGIGFSELAAFHAAVMKKGDLEKISYGTAAYALMDGIDTSEKLVDAKKQLNDTWMQIQMVNLVLARQNDALNALMKLQSCGVADKEILSIHNFLNGARLESARGNGTHNHFDSYLFNSRNGTNFGAPK